MTDKPVTHDLVGMEKRLQLTPEQKKAAFDSFFGSIPPDGGPDAARCADFLYDDKGMPGSAD